MRFILTLLTVLPLIHMAMAKGKTRSVPGYFIDPEPKNKLTVEERQEFCKECSCDEGSKCAYACQNCQDSCDVCNCRFQQCRTSCTNRCKPDPNPRYRARCHRCRCEWANCAHDCRAKCKFDYEEIQSKAGVTYNLRVIDGFSLKPVPAAPIKLRTGINGTRFEGVTGQDGTITIGPTKDYAIMSNHITRRYGPYTQVKVDGPPGGGYERSKSFLTIQDVEGGEIKQDLTIVKKPEKETFAIQFCPGKVLPADAKVLMSVWVLDEDKNAATPVICTTAKNTLEAEECDRPDVVIESTDENGHPLVISLAPRLSTESVSRLYAVMVYQEAMQGADDYSFDVVNIYTSITQHNKWVAKINRDSTKPYKCFAVVGMKNNVFEVTKNLFEEYTDTCYMKYAHT